MSKTPYLENYVQNERMDTDCDGQGYCPYCHANVLSYYNSKYCGNCAKQIQWKEDYDALWEEYKKEHKLESEE